MIDSILPENYPQVNISNKLAIADGLVAQLEHELFRAESLLQLLATSSGAAALTELDADQCQAVLVTISEMVSSARDTASGIERLID